MPSKVVYYVRTECSTLFNRTTREREEKKSRADSTIPKINKIFYLFPSLRRPPPHAFLSSNQPTDLRVQSSFAFAEGIVVSSNLAKHMRRHSSSMLILPNSTSAIEQDIISMVCREQATLFCRLNTDRNLRHFNNLDHLFVRFF